MLRKLERYITILKVFTKYNLFSLIYKDIHRDHISFKKCTCSYDLDNRSNAIKLRLAFEELGPCFVKLGQTLSKRSDLLPPTYVTELEKLQDRVMALDFDEMRASFSTECICEISECQHEHNPTCYHCNDMLDIFDEFDTKPIASASIGQVYRGVLNGKDVAVKIARPNLIDTINLDLSILDDMKPILVKILGLGSNFNIDAFLREFREMLHRELDYRYEAVNMKRLRENFKDVNNVIIPDSYMDYNRENILVMDYVEGTSVKNLTGVDQRTRAEYARIISSSYLKQVYLDGFYHADPHGGNIIVKDGTVAFIDLGAVGTVDDDLKRNMMNFFYAIYKQNTDMATEMLLKIADTDEEDVDIRGLKRDMDDLIADQHYGAGGRKSDSYAILALKYDLSLPAEFSTLERAVLLIEGVSLQLDPNYNIMSDAEELISKVLRERYSPKKAVEGIQFEADEYLTIIKEIPKGFADVVKTIRGYRIEKLERKSNIIQKYGPIKDLSKTLFLLVLLSLSAYLMIRGEGIISMIGITAFIVGALTGVYSILRS
ncbi:lipopolysaccharide core heptose(II) kinase RfaY [Methanolobus mangrovi]|uniref:Lipopolysaccharide core heptose(II) kinase RfaY n=1 Tax=Methanolobus mangrovi TaxID=3072977 RepID=A0AA51UH88_9EURY|nr:lipopolysaccharide core heptose(II) kinase RfaY [Methanolobus mangrovi]WMW23145.1 lipopolysaccharide core heptose(II) kinase RfaY [Methanolobus mangrovi]